MSDGEVTASAGVTPRLRSGDISEGGGRGIASPPVPATHSPGMIPQSQTARWVGPVKDSPQLAEW